ELTVISTTDTDVAWSLDSNGSGSVASWVTDFSDIEALIGSAGNDSFSVGTAVTIADITGGNGSDTLTGANTDNTWLIGSDGAGGGNTLNSTVAFNGIENFIGGTADDSFTVSEAGIAADIQGGGQGDEGDELTVVSTTGTEVTWSLTSNGSGSVASWVTDFSDIEALIGSDGNDKFVVDSTVTAANITGGNGSDTLTVNSAVT